MKDASFQENNSVLKDNSSSLMGSSSRFLKNSSIIGPASIAGMAKPNFNISGASLGSSNMRLMSPFKN